MFGVAGLGRLGLGIAHYGRSEICGQVETWFRGWSSGMGGCLCSWKWVDGAESAVAR